MSEPHALLVADTDETQRYVFESNRLAEIRGASWLLDDLNRETICDIVATHAGKVVFAGGGMMVARVPLNATQAVQREIEKAYVERCQTATVSVVARPLPDGTWAFGRFLTHLTHILQAHKLSKAAPPFIPTLPIQQRCQSCQQRAADASADIQTPDYQICTVCYTKHVNGTGNNKRTYWFDQFMRTTDDTKWDGCVAPYTVGEIAQASRREQLVGLIHLDGDGIGQRLKTLATETAYRDFSRTLEATAKTTVFDVLRAELHPASVPADELRPTRDERVTIFPFDILTIGGDDIWLLVPAADALRVATRIATEFGARMTNWAAKHLPNEPAFTMSGGVVLADDHTPIRMMVRLVKELIRRAKQEGGAIDFQVLHAPEAVQRTIGDTRESYPFAIQDKDKVRSYRLGKRPYTLAQMTRLLDDLATLNVATSQQSLLADALLTGRRNASLFYLYQSQRAPLASQYAALTATLERQQRMESADILPFEQIDPADDDSYRHRTALWDIIELLPFVGGKEGNDDRD